MGDNFWLSSSLKKEAQKESPIQEPYHIKVSLQKYCETFYKWPHPDFSKCCILCGVADCATYHGHYTRVAICAETGLSATNSKIHGLGSMDKTKQKNESNQNP
jgi:hypothetical protein